MRTHSQRGRQLSRLIHVPAAGGVEIRVLLLEVVQGLKTASRRKELAELVRAEFEASNGVYGYRRITASLARKGVGVDPDTVHRIMGSLGPGRRNRNERSAPLPRRPT